MMVNVANKEKADKVLKRTEHFWWLHTPAGSMGNKGTQNKTAGWTQRK